MPEISLFYGIRVTMYYKDHMPPHFHAEYCLWGSDPNVVRKYDHGNRCQAHLHFSYFELITNDGSGDRAAEKPLLQRLSGHRGSGAGR